MKKCQPNDWVTPHFHHLTWCPVICERLPTLNNINQSMTSVKQKSHSRPFEIKETSWYGTCFSKWPEWMNFYSSHTHTHPWTHTRAITHIWLMCKLISSLGTEPVFILDESERTHSTRANKNVISCRNRLAGVLEYTLLFSRLL